MYAHLRIPGEAILRWAESKKHRNYPTMYAHLRIPGEAILRWAESKKDKVYPTMYAHLRIPGEAILRWAESKKDKVYPTMYAHLYVRIPGEAILRRAESKKTRFTKQCTCIYGYRERPYFAELKNKREVPRDVRNSKVRRQDKFRRDWSRH